MEKALIRILLLILFLTPGIVASDLKELRETLIYPVVQIRVGTGGGSGTVIKKLDDGYVLILTNWHVVEDSAIGGIRFDLGGMFWHQPPIRIIKFIWDERGLDTGTEEMEGILVYHDVKEDLALIEVKLDLPVAELATVDEADTVEVLQAVAVVGCPLGSQPMLTEGRVTDLKKTIDGRVYWTTSAPVVGGNSGGALFANIDGKWKLVGVPQMVMMAGCAPVPHMNLMIRIAEIHEFLKEREDAESVDSDSWKIWFWKNDGGAGSLRPPILGGGSECYDSCSPSW